MSKATITITDNPNGTIEVAMDFQPPIEQDKPKTGAQQTAMQLLAIMRRDAQSMGDCIVSGRGLTKHIGGKLRNHGAS